jgi:hypothetical protein
MGRKYVARYARLLVLSTTGKLVIKIKENALQNHQI